MRRRVVIGPPGTGKTTELLRAAAESLEKGTRLDKLGFVSFTKKAVEEAKIRLGKEKKETPYFQTLHAMCFRLLGMSVSGVMQAEHYTDLGERLGLDLTGAGERRSADDAGEALKALQLVERARLSMRGLESVWQEADSDISMRLLRYVADGLKQYKEDEYLTDYTGMLEKYLDKGPIPILKETFVDEAQDLSRLQWKVADKLTSSCEAVTIAGDDDQAIYQWAGAAAEIFLERTLASDKTVLMKSWRLPQDVWSFAGKISKRIERRLEKNFVSNDEKGKVEFVSALDDLDMSKGEWLVLFRNQYMAKAAVEHCRREGHWYDCFAEPPRKSWLLKAAYAWEDARKGQPLSEKTEKEIRKRLHLEGSEELPLEKPWHNVFDAEGADDVEFIRAALRCGEKPSKMPRIRIDTVHGAKGGEAENVVLGTDLSYKTWKSYAEGTEDSADDERRVFYVGATRAKKNLFILRPETSYYFDLENE